MTVVLVTQINQSKNCNNRRVQVVEVIMSFINSRVVEVKETQNESSSARSAPRGDRSAKRGHLECRGCRFLELTFAALLLEHLERGEPGVEARAIF